MFPIKIWKQEVDKSEDSRLICESGQLTLKFDTSQKNKIPPGNARETIQTQAYHNLGVKFHVGGPWKLIAVSSM